MSNCQIEWVFIEEPDQENYHWCEFAEGHDGDHRCQCGSKCPRRSDEIPNRYSS